MGHPKGLRIIGLEEGEEAQLEGVKNIFNKIIEENFPNLKKDMPMKYKKHTKQQIDCTKGKRPLNI